MSEPYDGAGHPVDRRQHIAQVEPWHDAGADARQQDPPEEVVLPHHAAARGAHHSAEAVDGYGKPTLAGLLDQAFGDPFGLLVADAQAGMRRHEVLGHVRAERGGWCHAQRRHIVHRDRSGTGRQPQDIPRRLHVGRAQTAVPARQTDHRGVVVDRLAGRYDVGEDLGGQPE